MMQLRSLSNHLAASVLALYFAWYVSQTTFITTGVQFIAPLLIVLNVHTLWYFLLDWQLQDFTKRIFQRCVGTTLVLTVTIIAFHAVAPQPAAAIDERFLPLLGVTFCVAMLISIAAVAVLAGYSIFIIVVWIWRLIRPKSKNGPKTLFFDIASLAIAFFVLIAASLEGVPNFYRFNENAVGIAKQRINASSDQVWKTLQTATSPQFPLPQILSVFPQPIAVPLDEGITVGAKRKVKFVGREGVGILSLQVVEKSENRLVFHVVGDTTPFAAWMRFKSFTYVVEPKDEHTTLSLFLHFDRKLAPAWFFKPVMEASTHFAMKVLAADVKTRAESL